jgi:hypothetical protein
MKDFTNSTIIGFDKFDESVKCSCCGRPIKNLYIFKSDEDEVYVGTECTKTIILSQEQNKKLEKVYKDFKSELSQIKKMSISYQYRKEEFNDRLQVVVEDYKSPYSNYIVKLIAPSRYNADVMYEYNIFFFKTDRFMKLNFIK